MTSLFAVEDYRNNANYNQHTSQRQTDNETNSCFVAQTCVKRLTSLDQTIFNTTIRDGNNLWIHVLVHHNSRLLKQRTIFMGTTNFDTQANYSGDHPSNKTCISLNDVTCVCAISDCQLTKCISALVKRLPRKLVRWAHWTILLYSFPPFAKKKTCKGRGQAPPSVFAN